MALELKVPIIALSQLSR
ncbi:hypothetical protein, partial [Mycoplasmopsis bovis]